MTSESGEPLPLIQKALQSNSDRQLLLVNHSNQLASELVKLDKLIGEAEFNDGDCDLNSVKTLEIPGGSRPLSLIPPTGFIQLESPFNAEASQRNRYLDFTNARPFTVKERQALARAVAQEKTRQEYMLSKGMAQGTEQDGGINWKVVAEKVSDVSPGQATRRPVDCRVKWISDQQPSVNHSKWSPSERTQLNRVHSQHVKEKADKPVDWTQIATELGTNRPAIDCMREVQRDEIFKFNQDYEDKLLEGIKIYGTNNWYPVAQYISPLVTPEQAKRKYAGSVAPSQAAWSKKELARLKVMEEIYGTAFVEMLPYFPGRSRDDVRKTCKRDNGDFGGEEEDDSWTEEEDNKLLEVAVRLGMKWDEVLKEIGSDKTEKDLEERYELLTQAPGKKKKKAPKKQPKPRPKAVPKKRPAKRKRADSLSDLSELSDEVEESAGPSTHRPAAKKSKPSATEESEESEVEPEIVLPQRTRSGRTIRPAKR